VPSVERFGLDAVAEKNYLSFWKSNDGHPAHSQSLGVLTELAAGLLIIITVETDKKTSKVSVEWKKVLHVFSNRKAFG
jgi:hypothetical protein